MYLSILRKQGQCIRTRTYVCGVPLRPLACALIGRVGQRLITPNIQKPPERGCCTAKDENHAD